MGIWGGTIWGGMICVGIWGEDMGWDDMCGDMG